MTVTRKDRQTDGGKDGGVLIATKPRLVVKHRLDLETDCELTWIHDTVVPPREDTATGSAREVISNIVRTAWAKAQEWTVAWKAGGNQLKLVAEAVINQKGEGFTASVHNAALQLRISLAKMETCVNTMDELLENMKKVQNLQSEETRNKPLFSTLNLCQIVHVMESICEDYRMETEAKSGVCSVLPISLNIETLNSAVTLWNHHIHIVTHQFPLKSLLRETQQL